MSTESELFHGPDAPVRNLATHAVATVAADSTLREACVKLLAVDVGVLMVRDDSGPIGLISERDVIDALASGADPDDARVAAATTSEVLWVDGGTTCGAARDLMLAEGVRHLPIDGPAAQGGMVSARDLLAALDD